MSRDRNDRQDKSSRVSESSILAHPRKKSCDILAKLAESADRSRPCTLPNPGPGPREAEIYESYSQNPLRIA
jgi:hypothetical protein